MEKEKDDRREIEKEKEKDKDKKYLGIHPEIGCNNEVVELLCQMNEHRRMRLNVVVLYKSK